MPKLRYVEKRFSASSLELVDQANSIIEEYAAQGFVLTLRQLYYQFVARGLIPNKQSEYKRLVEIISDARLAGLVDWEAIEDRTRFLSSLGHWADPAEIINSAAYSFHIDKWANQPCRVEVWIEKDALVGVIEKLLDEKAWEAACQVELSYKQQLENARDHWPEVTGFLSNLCGG